MIFVHASAVHNSIPGRDQPDPAKELKKLSGKVYRRTDHFIQLAVLGAHKATAGKILSKKTAIYMTSGHGNVSVFVRICTQRRRENLLPRPVDFINLLSNSAGFYVAAHLGLEGKNLFVTHHRFPVQMALLAAQNDLRMNRHEMVLLGGVDEWNPKQELAGKLLGVAPQTRLGEGSNWLLLSTVKDGAEATIKVYPHLLDCRLLAALLAASRKGTFLAFSHHVPKKEIIAFLKTYRQCKRFVYEGSCGYYETRAFFAMNHFLERKKGRLIHIDGCAGRYMVFIVSNSDDPLP